MFSDNDGHCFSCGFHVFPKHYAPKKETNNVPKSLRPSDYTREIPARCLEWLLQYGLPWSHWKESIGYSPKESRLVFGLEESPGQLAFSIGRHIPEPGTEYERKPRKWYVWGDSHKHCHVVRQVGELLRSDDQEECGPIVLVEDLISAHKVAAAGATAVPLFGTEIHDAHLYYLINENKPVILWLDKDQEQSVKRKALRLESLINQSVRVVTSERDPKLLSFKEINAEITI